MASLKDKDVTAPDEKDETTARKDISELPPSGTSLHKRRRGEAPASLNVKPQTPSDVDSSPCTAALTPNDFWNSEAEPSPDPVALCESMIQKLKEKNEHLSQQENESISKAKETLEAVDQLENLLDLLEQFVTLKENNAEMLRKLEDAEHIKRLNEAKKRIDLENERLKAEEEELQWIGESIDDELEHEYGLAVFDSMLFGSKNMKRSGSKWKSPSRFGGSLLRRQRSRSAGGEESDAGPLTPLRRRSEAISCKEVDKSKVSKWTRVKAAFRWEKAQWPAGVPMGGATGAVAAGALVGAVALAGSAPPSTTGTLNHGETLRDASLTPGSPMSLTPNSSCEELRMDSGSYNKSGILRCDENDNTFLHAPTQDDSSTSPSPNKLHKSPWGKMREIIQTRRESVRKKSSRGSKSSPDVIPSRRRSMSDGGDSDAPPALTLTIPSSEELESDPHPLLRKQRSLELSARPPQQRPPRASKWSKVKKAFLTSASASVPSSPSRHSAFFTDAETEGLSSGCEASAVRDEIARDYAALQSRLRQEFSDRQGKLYAASRPVATEDQLSADFMKKLTEWQRMKGVRQPPPVPARQDLSDDFLKKWDAWTRMKETNSVPAWEEEAKPDEVLVQTSTGLFKFQGISRSFTRKLHEWEKSRGIAPEASTSALLRAAKARSNKAPAAPLTRTQSDGSVAPSLAGSGRHHASSLSVNDADTIDVEFERDSQSLEGYDASDGDASRGAVLVEVEAEEVCTASVLVCVSPRHTPQQPVYTYGQAEPRLLCETRSALTGTANTHQNPTGVKRKDNFGTKSKEKICEQTKLAEKNNKAKRKLGRQTSIEEDAQLIREAIEEVERGSSCRHKEIKPETFETKEVYRVSDTELPSTSKDGRPRGNATPKRQNSIEEDSNGKRKEADKSNGNNKKKTKSRARLEREQSKPSESDTEVDVDTVTVEIPRRRKRTKKPTEKPWTPPTSLHSDSEGDVFVLKLKAPEPRQSSPEVIVKTTRKIFSPVVRSGESVPSAVIPVNVEDLADVNSSGEIKHRSRGTKQPKEAKHKENKGDINSRSKSSGDLQESEEQRPRNRPPLPLSPSSQRKPQAKETAPSIRIMIQRYNMKIQEEDVPGHTSGASSGASSPAWRSPAAERRRPPDMPVGVNIRNNPFLEREVQKSASACQLSRKETPTTEKPLTPTPCTSLDGVLKSHSANALHPEQKAQMSREQLKESQDTITCTASTDTIVPPDLTRNLPVFSTLPGTSRSTSNVRRQMTESPNHPLTLVSEIPFDRSVSLTEAEAVARASERAARIKAARDRFLSSPVQMRREGTSSASDLRGGDRSSRISCESDVTEAVGGRNAEEAALGRSASTGMVNVDREAWERVAEGVPAGQQRRRSPRSRFSLARLAAKLRRKDEGAVSRLCRQSLLVQLRNKQ